MSERDNHVPLLGSERAPLPGARVSGRLDRECVVCLLQSSFRPYVAVVIIESYQKWFDMVCFRHRRHLASWALNLIPNRSSIAITCFPFYEFEPGQDKELLRHLRYFVIST